MASVWRMIFRGWALLALVVASGCAIGEERTAKRAVEEYIERVEINHHITKDEKLMVVDEDETSWTVLLGIPEDQYGHGIYFRVEKKSLAVTLASVIE